MQDRDPEIHIDQVDAKAGRNRGMNMRALLIGTGLAAAALTVIWVTGALRQDPVEGQGTATGRIQAEADRGGEPVNDIGMIDPDVPADTSETQAVDQPRNP
jgi:hypothetical protein